MTPREIGCEYGEHRDLVGGGWLSLRRGEVTDDTEMSLALGKSILACGGVDARAAAESFDEWMRSRPKDIGNTVRRGLVHFRNSGNAEAPESEHAAGNGACMRILPVALATWGCSEEKILESCRAQSHVTHNNALSDLAGETTVRLIQASFNGASKRDLLLGPVARMTSEGPKFEFRDRRELNPTGYIVETMRAVMQAFFGTDTFEQCLIDVVNRGGDADTTGAIAGMIAGAHYGAHNIPRRWLRHLERSVRRACFEQAMALLELAPRYSAASQVGQQ